ncbi:hypothetical protein HBA54_15665 [Pelagibius litoralis]|uniref:Uncharacterized protein n=1 Tax=Pelagibius litoralis TaxID=374515 RepID=A0A967EZ05_9PROT|nr:hypothetical protein [Pelagibius litoralis]NIA70042.1 hypothetical protein [Pelagibius litoralis]
MATSACNIDSFLPENDPADAVSAPEDGGAGGKRRTAAGWALGSSPRVTAEGGRPLDTRIESAHDAGAAEAVSRRSLLAAAAALPALGLALPALAALAARPADAGLPNPDAELFRRIAVALERRRVYARARRLRQRLHDIRDARRGYDTSHMLPAPWREPLGPGDRDAWLHDRDLFYRYGEAVREAVAVPARTVAGLYAKLDLAVVAARRGTGRIYMYEDREWLEAALDDLRGLAAGQGGPTG